MKFGFISAGGDGTPNPDPRTDTGRPRDPPVVLLVGARVKYLHDPDRSPRLLLVPLPLTVRLPECSDIMAQLHAGLRVYQPDLAHGFTVFIVVLLMQNDFPQTFQVSVLTRTSGLPKIL